MARTLPVIPAETVARLFGCTPEQVRAQWARNAAGAAKDLVTAQRTGRKVRGYTAQQCAASVDQCARGARS